MTVHRARKKRPSLRTAPYQSALETIGELEPGCRIVGMTKGQFSLLDLIRAVLASTGPAHLIVSTWTAGIRDAENAGMLIERGELLGLKLLCDRSFPRRQPRYCARILEIFGPDSIRMTRTHAKFALLHNDDWHVVIRSSMNLNRNPRFEQFDLDDDAELYEFFERHWLELEYEMVAGLDATTRECDQVFARALGGGLAEGTSLDDSLQSDPVDVDALLAEVAALRRDEIG